MDSLHETGHVARVPLGEERVADPARKKPRNAYQIRDGHRCVV
jgi:hypothetical protein